MRLIDYNQVCIANLMVQLGQYQNADLNVDMLRHMILNTIRANNNKFQQQYGELIVCTDNTRNWRKDIFPYYKANRKDTRDSQDIDWPTFFKAIDTIKNELRETLGYRVINVDKAEADDIIGVLVHQFGQINTDPFGPDIEPILIISGDKDFMQLQKFQNVKQYDTIRTRWLVTETPKKFLYEHIIKGDRGDGIPNIKSVPNSFVDSIRQKPVRQTFIDAREFSEEEKARFIENRQIIDLSMTPQNIKDEVLKQFTEQADLQQGNLLNYFMEHNLKLLTQNIGDFKYGPKITV